MTSNNVNTKFPLFSSNISTLVISLIPVFKSCPPCPICMPKYATLFGFFGLKLANYSYYLEPIMLLSMTTTLITMVYQTQTTKISKTPVLVATISCLFLYVAKFILDHFWAIQFAMLSLLGTILLHYHYLSQQKACCAN